MKIVHITTVHDPFDTRIFEKMCQAAAKAGCEVTLVATHDREEVASGISIRPIRRRNNRLARAIFGVREAVALAKHIKADIYHIHDPELLLGITALRRSGKVVYDMHENVSASIRHKVWMSPWIRPIVAKAWSLLERILLSNIPVIYAELSYAVDYPWVRQFEFILNMPKIEKFSQVAEAATKSRKVVYVGAVTEARGSLITMQAIRLLNEASSDIQFVCIGPASKEHFATLQELAHKYRLTNITFTGRLRANEAWSLASTCQVGLATVLPLPNYVNSYPTKLFEYMAMSMPVVASNFPLYRGIVEKHECGICVDPECPEEVAEAIRILLDNPSLAKQMGYRGKVAVTSKFRWEIEADKLLAFYSLLLNARE